MEGELFSAQLPASDDEDVGFSRKRKSFVANAELEAGVELESEEEKLPVFRRKREKKERRPEPSASAQGRLEGTRATFTETNERFRGMTPDDFDREKAPFDWDWYPEEVDSMHDYMITKSHSKGVLQSDKLYLFLLQYAGASFRDMSRVVKSPARREFGGGGHFGADAREGGRIMRRRRSEVQRPSVGGPVAGASPPPSPLGPSPPFSPPPEAHRRDGGEAPPFFPLAEERVIPPFRGAGGGGVPPREEQERRSLEAADNDERSFALSHSMGRPEIVGVQDIAPDVFAHVNLAFTNLQMSIPAFRELRDFHSLINTEVAAVRTLFAQLAKLMSAGNFWFSGTRSRFNDENKTIVKHQKAIVYALGSFRWNSYRRDFEPLGASGSGYGPSLSRDAPQLPRYNQAAKHYSAI